jgi:outer membrane protein OmpA-like peptidoglycan-associated protein
VGGYIGIYIPSDILFVPNTAEFTPQAKPILDSAADILQRYPNNNILISGNTSGFGQARWEQHLSEKRAQRVAAYLWNAGVSQFKGNTNNTRKFQTVGNGDYLPIASDLTNKGIRENSRIQITSYPSDCNLNTGRKSQTFLNYAGLDDDDYSSAGDCEGDSC